MTPEVGVAYTAAFLTVLDQGVTAADLMRPGVANDAQRAQRELAAFLPGHEVTPEADGTFDEGWRKPVGHGVAFAGAYGGLVLIAHAACAQDDPGLLDRLVSPLSEGRRAYLVGCDSLLEWFGFGAWDDTALIRSVSGDTRRGILTDVGVPLPFEEPLWAAVPSYEPDDLDDQAGLLVESGTFELPFSALDFADRATAEAIGQPIEGVRRAGVVDPEELPVRRFTVAPGA
ncbi:MAG: hypothetical protein GEV11_01165 [Streptosporangiales bacterium]|nr:hypothetical protein [Streptosporangiales bacterium]